MEEKKQLLSANSSIWAGLLFLSSGWLFLFPAFTARNLSAGLAFVVIGAGFFLLAFRGAATGRLDRSYLVFVVPLVLSCFFIPFPYSLGPMILTLGILIGCLWGRASWAGVGLGFAGVLLTIQAAVLPFYSAFATRYHSAALFAPAANLLLKVFGVQTAATGGSVFVQGSQHVNAFAITWEKLALLPMIQVLVGGAFILLVFGAKPGRKRALVYLLAAVAVYAVAREVFLTLVFTGNEKLALFWKPAITWLTLIPLFLLLPGLLRLNGPPRLVPSRMGRRAWLAGAAAFLCVVFLVSAWGYHDPGTRKQGRVLVDEKHSNWEWTTEKFDTRWYGEKSGYNYYSLYTFLDAYYKLNRNFNELTPGALSGYDVLVLKTPTQPYTSSEVASIEGFVRAGGGLFLIGDHTNVFGTSSFINPVAERFGIEYRYDSTYELARGGLTEYSPPAVLPHPIVQRMPLLLFGTSCSLRIAPGVRSVISGFRMKSNHADYSQKNFFPRQLDTSSTEFGSFVQAAAVSHGRGRVFAFTDSTMFSNFWMFVPGKPELALGAMGWLNRRNGSSALFIVFLVLGLAFLLLTCYLAFRERGLKTLLAVLCAGVLAFGLATAVVMAEDRSAFAQTQPRKKVTTVTLEQSHCDFVLPSTFKGFNSPAGRQYLTFYVWNQRLGYFPSVSDTIGDATRKKDMVVLLNPVKTFSSKDRDRLIKYVKDGGSLVVLDGALNKNSTANQVLELFGMRMDPQTMGQKDVFFGTGRYVTTTPEALSITGGRALAATATGQPVFSIKRVGKGVVGAFADSHLFSDSQLGNTGTMPNEQQVRASELEFWLLETLLKR